MCTRRRTILVSDAAHRQITFTYLTIYPSDYSHFLATGNPHEMNENELEIRLSERGLTSKKRRTSPNYLLYPYLTIYPSDYNHFSATGNPSEMNVYQLEKILLSMRRRAIAKSLFHITRSTHQSTAIFWPPETHT